MPIRLSKACKELNIGIHTAVDFLAKKGNKIESNPNYVLSDDFHLLLEKEFKKDMDLKKSTVHTFPKPVAPIEKPKVDNFVPTVVPDDMKIKINIVQSPPPVAPSPEKDATTEVHPVVIEVAPESNTPSTNTPESEIAPKPDNIAEPLTDHIHVEPKVEIVENVSLEDAVTTSVVSDNSAIDVELPVDTQTPTKGSSEVIVVRDEEKEIIKTKEGGETIIEDAAITTTENSEEVVTAGALTGSTPKKIQFTATGDVIDLPVDKIKVKGNLRDASPSNKKGFGYKTNPSNPTTNGANGNEEKSNGKTLKLTLKKQGEDSDKLKRPRIKDKPAKVDVGNYPSSDANNNIKKPILTGKVKKPTKVAVDKEEIDKKIKDTLASIAKNSNRNTGGKKYRRDKRDSQKTRTKELENQEREEEKLLKLTEFVTVNELAVMMNVSVNEVIKTCITIGMMVSINQRLDAETINIVASEFDYSTVFVSADVIEAIGVEVLDDEADLEPRAPIVTVMGHVDHGKTSLLDYIRKTNVIAGEAGGITQHIGAYNVKLENGLRITFLDTPGHEAFTAMRARGAKVTDIAIIIVAADDSVMPQTVEAINHASAAGVPIIFAINKIDKQGANPEKIKQALANMNYIVEDWQGKYQSQDISAKQGIGINELLEKVLLEAELLELKANPNRKAVGSVIESSLDKGRGFVSTVLVQNGTLKVGDVVLAGTHYGKIKAMFNERNQRIQSAKPAEPVIILGLSGAPQAGDNFNVMSTEQEARDIANRREQLQREQNLRTKKHFTLEELGRRIALGDFKELNIIVKGDVDGSVEALSDSLLKLSTETIQVNVIHKAVGAISDSDILLAAASNAIICGFQVRPTVSARKMAEKEEIDVRLHSIIYDAIDEIKFAMQGMLSPEIKEEITATVEVREVFRITKVGVVAGCLVREGKIRRSNKVRVIRDGIVMFSGDLDSLKRFKEDVKEVSTNYECGISIKNHNDIKVGDIIESYEVIEVKKVL